MVEPTNPAEKRNSFDRGDRRSHRKNLAPVGKDTESTSKEEFNMAEATRPGARGGYKPAPVKTQIYRYTRSDENDKALCPETLPPIYLLEQ